MTSKKNKEEATIADYLFGSEQPQVPEMEESVLGACMDIDGMYLIVRDILDPSKFYKDQNRIIMEVMDRLAFEGKPIDMLSVTEMAKQMQVLDAVGGGYYIAELTKNYFSAANIEAQARKVAEKWMAREMIRKSCDVIRSCYEGLDVFEVINEDERCMRNIVNFKRGGEMSIHDAAMEMHRLAQARRDRGGDMVGLPFTDLPELDLAINGQEPGDVILVAGRPGAGKSSLITNTLDCCVSHKIPAYFWSGEAPMHKMAARLVSMRSGVPVRSLEKGEYLEDDRAVDSVISEIKGTGITVKNGSMDIGTMRRLIEMENRLHKTTTFIFDRVEIFHEFLKAKSIGDKSAAVGDITGAMREVANKLGVSVVALSQLGKSADGKKPQMSDVYGGTLIEGNCTKIIGVWNPVKFGNDTNEAGIPYGKCSEIVIMKNNYDAQEDIMMLFDGPCQCWRSPNDIPVFQPSKTGDGNPF